MKQLFRSILSVAAAATLLIGCSKDATETPAPAAGEFTLNLVTGADTRTEIYDPGEGKGVNIKWSEGDVAAIYVNGTLGKGTTSSITDGIITFSSSISPEYMGEGGNQPGIYTAQAVYPAEACTYAKRNADNDAIQAFELNLPAAQEATTATFDKNADILVAKNMDVEITAQDIKDLKKTVENYTFGRTTAITRLNFTVTNDELLNSEETVKSIALTVEGKSLAGTFIFDPAAFKSVKSTTDLTPVEDPNNMFKTGSNKVTVTLTDTPAVNAAFTAWISTAPVSLTNGDKLTFTVTTDAGTTITKTATVGKDLAFMTTRLNTMTVNLNDGVTIDKPVVVEPGAHAVDFIFKDMGYDNGVDLTTKNVAKDPITIVFSKGSNKNNAPKYYNSSTAVHTYFGNTFTVSGPEGITIKTIELTFKDPGKYNAEITTNPEGYIKTGLWSGSAQKVAFTLSGTSGQRRILSIKVTYDGEAAPVEPVQLATPEVTAEQVPGTTSVKLSWNAVSNANKYIYTFGSQENIETTETAVTIDDLAAGTTYNWTVIAKANDETLYLPSEAATGSITVETPPTGTSDWVEVTDFSTITTGQYIYVVETGGTHYYMKNTQATKAGDVKPGTLTALPTTPGFAAGEDMVLIFTGDQTNGFTIGNASGDFLGTINDNNGVSMKSSNSTKWVVNTNDKCKFTLKGTTANPIRYLGLYTPTDGKTNNYRAYKSEGNNIVDNKTYKLYRYTK